MPQISLAWVFGFAEYHFHLPPSEKRFTALARLSFSRWIPRSVKSPFFKATKATVQALAVTTNNVFSGIFDRFKGVANSTLDLSIALGLVFVLFLVLAAPCRTETAG